VDLVARSLAALVPLATTGFDEHALVLAMGAIGLVVVASGLVSGLVERLPISQVLVFVFLGVVVGPWGLGVFDLGIDSPAVQTLATVSLTLVLFTDAIKINLGQLRSNWVLPALALGPGTLLTIAFVGGASWLLFGLSVPMALLVGTILASTDAVLLRDVTRDARIPLSVRHALSVEAGTNDLIVLPLTLFLALLASGVARSGADWARFAFSMLVLAPVVGIAIAWLGIRAVDWLRKRRLIRRDYESIYSIGIAFLAFAAAQLLGGSGFVAAFAAGATIAALDIELCDCFLEYGETTAEIAMLLTFVVLGSALVAAALGAFGLAALVFALFCLLVARPVAMLASLWRTEASPGGRLLLAWFGPRGLNSILLLILAVSLGIPDPSGIFGIVATVVIASVVLHGTTATPLAAWYGRRARAAQLPEETLVDAGSLFHLDGDVRPVPRTTVAALRRMLDDGEPVTVVDVRRWQPFEASGRRIPGSLRIPIDDIPHRIAEIPRDRPVVLSCA
jgi:NhaP-type Na+/H+ or K+/H+ antiporter